MRLSSPTACARRAAALLALSLASAAPAPAVTVVVGNGAGCTHATIQAAIDAAESALEPSIVRITRSASYTQLALTVETNEELELTGGYANCTQSDNDGIKTTLDGAGGAAASVLRIVTGSSGNVLVRHLRIQGGDVSGASPGGGIFFGGSGRGEIRDTFVLGNIAGNGGGIYAGGAVAGVRFVIGANVRIAGNTARFSGGGVFVDGLALTMVEPNTTITLNSAFGTSTTGLGGGLFIRNLEDRPAVAHIGGGGDGQIGVIEGNEARVGGGIAVIGETYGNEVEADTARILLFTREGQARVSVRNNFASDAGGGLFIEPRTGAFGANSRAIADIWQARIDGNLAPSGAAIYLADTEFGGSEEGGEVYFNVGRPTGAAACLTAVPCGSISGNIAQTGGGQVTDGAIVQVQSGGIARIGTALAGVEWRDNRGGRLIDVQPEFDDFDPDALVLANALLVDNELSQHLIRGQQARLTVVDSTIAGNSIGTGNVLAMNADLTLQRSILWQPGMTSLSRSGGALVVSGMIASEITSLGAPPAVIAADPRFVDPANGDYQLRAASPAVDFDPAVGGNDVTGEPHDVNLELKPDLDGPRDAGAFELQALGNLVLNRNADVDLRLWSIVPAAITLDLTQNVSGSVTGGSFKVSGTPGADRRLLGASQCIHLPGPARYFFGVLGQTEIGPLTQRDSVVVTWSLRASNPPGTCNGGTPVASGEVVVTRNSSWTPSPSTVIDVAPSQWSPDASITFSLVVIDNGLALPPVATGWFDGFSLLATPLDPNALFEDGFEAGATSD